MKYFKITNGSEFVGVGTTHDLRTHQKKHNILLATEGADYQYIQIGDDLYRDKWMSPVTGDYPHKNATIEEITKEKYDVLFKAKTADEEYPIDLPEVDFNEPIEEVPVVEDPDLDYVRESKIREMSKACRKEITSGIVVKLSDGGFHHFSFEMTDQINIQSLVIKANAGISPLPWHEDNGVCKYYSAEDIIAIFNAMEQLQTYNTTYFNSLKNYINSLESIKKISDIFYGVRIPREYQSDVLRDLNGTLDD